MSEACSPEPLRKFRQAIESLEPNKQVAAAKWLEGVIVAQALTTEEREKLVEAANEYVESLEEEEYVDSVNALVDYLGHVGKSARRARKRGRKVTSSLKQLEQACPA
jgi:hypothetical protein